jgi:hypothetical protein
MQFLPHEEWPHGGFSVSSIMPPTGPVGVGESAFFLGRRTFLAFVSPIFGQMKKIK